MIEACAAATFAIFFCGARSQRNRAGKRLATLRLTDELKTVAVRKADVTHEDVEAKIVEEEQRFATVLRRGHIVAGTPQQFRERAAGVFVVFYNQDVHTIYSERRRRCV